MATAPLLQTSVSPAAGYTAACNELLTEEVFNRTIGSWVTAALATPSDMGLG